MGIPTKMGPKAAAPLLVLGVGLLATLALVRIEPERESTASEVRVPLVPVVEAQLAPARLQVRAHGTAQPRTETDLVIEVAGRIEWTAPEFESGGYFESGQTLLRIDPRDYVVGLERAKAAEERAASQNSLAEANVLRRRNLRDAGAASAAHLDESENQARVAAANLREAVAAREQAELDLERTEVKAPFDGRVRERILAIGQYAGPGTPAARIYDSGSAEIRLSIPSEELQYLDLPVGPSEGEVGPSVTLEGRFAGKTTTWPARIVRTEGALDSKTRMMVAVAEVLETDDDLPPLPIGLFLDATIEGRAFDDAISLPRDALRGESEVLVIAAGSLVEVRQVQVLRAESNRIWVQGGLADGERVAVRVLGLLTEGMKVRVEAHSQPTEGSSLEASGTAAQVER